MTPNLFFVACAFGVTAKKLSPNLSLKDLLSSKSFVLLFRFLMHLELILLHVAIQLFQHYLLKSKKDKFLMGMLIFFKKKKDKGAE